MKVFYSASQNGFYDDNQTLPADALEIAESLRTELITAQNAGGVIRPGSDGMPVIIPSADYVPELTEEEQRWFAESKKQSLLSEATTRIGPLACHACEYAKAIFSRTPTGSVASFSRIHGPSSREKDAGRAM